MGETFGQMRARQMAEDAARNAGQPQPTPDLNLDAPAAEPEDSIAVASDVPTPIAEPAPAPPAKPAVYSGLDEQKAKYNHIANAIRAKFADRFNFDGLTDEQIIQKHHARFGAGMDPQEYDKKLQDTYAKDWSPSIAQKAASVGKVVGDVALSAAPFIGAEVPKVAGQILKNPEMIAKGAGFASKLASPVVAASHLVNGLTDAGFIAAEQQKMAGLGAPDVAGRTQQYYAQLSPGLKAQGFTDAQIMDEARRRAQNVETGRQQTWDSMDQGLDDMQRQQVLEPAKAITDALFFGLGEGPLAKVLAKAGLAAPAGAKVGASAAELAMAEAKAAAYQNAPAITKVIRGAVHAGTIGGVAIGAGGAARGAIEAAAAAMTPAEIAQKAAEEGRADAKVGALGGAILGGGAEVVGSVAKGLEDSRVAARDAAAKKSADEVDASRLAAFQEGKAAREAESARVEDLIGQRRRRIEQVRADKLNTLGERFNANNTEFNTQGVDPDVVARGIVVQEGGLDAIGTEAGLRARSKIAAKIRTARAADAELSARGTVALPGAPTPVEAAPGTLRPATNEEFNARPALTQPGGLSGVPSQVEGAGATALTRPTEPRMQGAPAATPPAPALRTQMNELQAPPAPVRPAEAPAIEPAERLAAATPVTRTPEEHITEALKPVKAGRQSGHTFNIDTMEPDNTPGHVVSVISRNVSAARLTPEAVMKFREDMAPWIEQQKAAGRNMSIGVFALENTPGKYSIDLNVNVPTEAEAHEIGRQTGQESFAKIGPNGWERNIPVEPEGVRPAAEVSTPKATEAPVPVPATAVPSAPTSRESVLPAATPVASRVTEAISKLTPEAQKHVALSERNGAIHIDRLGLEGGALAQKGAIGKALDEVISTADAHGLPITMRLTKIDSNGGKIPIEKQMKGYLEPRGFGITASTKLPEGQLATADVTRPAVGKPAVENMGMTSPVAAEQTAKAIAKPDSPATENLAAPAPPPAPGKWHQADLFFDNNIAQARERIKAREAEFPETERKKKRERGSLSNKPLEPGAPDHVSYDWADFADRVQIGVNLLLKHGLNKVAWVDQMVKELGAAIKPHLDKLYAESVSTLAGRRASGLDEVRLVTDKYTHESGLGAGATKHDLFPALDEKFAKRVATAYDMLDNAEPGTPEYKEAENSYKALNQEIEAQYKAMTDAGYKVEFTKDDPYATSADMRGDIATNKRIRAFASDESHHPFMTANQTNMFRAVHDFFGHAAEGYEFGPRGEDAAFRKHASTLSEDALPALTSETRGQNSWVNFHGDHQSLAPKDRPFAEQKFGLLPEWTYADVMKERTNRAETNRLGRGLKAGKASPQAFANAAESLARGVRPASVPATIKARFMADGLNTINERMQTHPESADWYHKDIAKMHDMVAERIPEVHTPGGQALFDLLLGFTSPQKPVTDNFAIAYEMMHDYTRTGKIPMLRRFGQEVNTVSRNWVPKLNELIKAHDGNLEAMRDFLLSKDDKGVYNVTKQFGPKVGPFTLNIQGVHDQVTIDVWMVRRLRRLAGQMFKEGAFNKNEVPTAAEQSMLTDGIRELAKSTGLDPDAVQAILWDHEKDVWDKAGHRAPKIPFSKAAEGVFQNIDANHKAISRSTEESAQRDLFENSEEGRARMGEANIMRSLK